MIDCSSLQFEAAWPLTNYVNCVVDWFISCFLIFRLFRPWEAFLVICKMSWSCTWYWHSLTSFADTVKWAHQALITGASESFFFIMLDLLFISYMCSFFFGLKFLFATRFGLSFSHVKLAIVALGSLIHFQIFERCLLGTSIRFLWN